MFLIFLMQCGNVTNKMQAKTPSALRLRFDRRAIPGGGTLIVTQQSVQSLLARPGFNWITRTTDGFALYVEPDSFADSDAAELGPDAQLARQRVLEYLEEPAYEPTVSIFYVDSEDRMRDLIGRPSNATSYYSTNVVCLVWSDEERVGAKHELLHVVAMNLWSVPQRWVNEGAAVDVAGSWLGHDVNALCKFLRDRGELPELSEITSRYDSLSPYVAYPAAGSFVRFLRENYGVAAFRQVWDGGSGPFPSATGLNTVDLQVAWHVIVDAADSEGIEYEIR